MIKLLSYKKKSFPEDDVWKRVEISGNGNILVNTDTLSKTKSWNRNCELSRKLFKHLVEHQGYNL